jgi:hypothetical protein
LRRIGSTGGMIVFVFFEGSLTGVSPVLNPLGGSGPEGDRRISGSIGGTMGVDFLTPASEVEIAEVLLGDIGSVEVGDVIGGTTGGTVDAEWHCRGRSAAA